MRSVAELENCAEAFTGARAIVARTTLEAGSVKDLVFKLKATPGTLVILGNVVEGKVSLSIGVSDDLITDKGWHAGNAANVGNPQ